MPIHFIKCSFSSQYCDLSQHSTLFPDYTPADKGTRFDEGIKAISMTLQQSLCISDTFDPRTVIIFNCQSTIQAIASNKYPYSHIIKQESSELTHLHKLGTTIHFQWVSSHRGVIGNNTVDPFTKKVFLQNNEEQNLRKLP